MKIFLSSLESGGGFKKPLAENFKDLGLTHFKWNLLSFYYICQADKDLTVANYLKTHSDEILIDSGAHSFQKGKKVDWFDYTHKYADFIKKFDAPNVIGYFEMDVDNIIGYQNVLELRKVLEDVSDKIIPVWHKNRGIDDFKKMCQTHKGKIVAVSGFRNEDIRDEQYVMFLKYAWKCGCSLHCLGMTRKEILNKVPFDYTDSSSWKQNGIFGRISNIAKVTKDFSKTSRHIVHYENYKQAMKMQDYYYEKWKGVKEKCLKEMI